jgi:hypothetical protein
MTHDNNNPTGLQFKPKGNPSMRLRVGRGIKEEDKSK